MLAIRKDRLKENDNYRALALYICGCTEKNPEEKMLASWFANCVGEDFPEKMMEIEAVQALNAMTTAHKTYHLILSFRPEDEVRLTLEVMADIDARFAQALGYGEHQRCCGIHKNTNNMHMHIAYNMIHPEKFNRHEPFRDFYTLARTCREVEEEYSLVVDPGLEADHKPTRPNIQAQTMEAHSGQQSFQNYALERQSQILNALHQAQSWQDVHAGLALHGMGIKKSGAGLVIHNLHGREHIKASSVSRELSLKQLAAFLGEFQTPMPGTMPEQERYQRRALQRNPNRENLYSEYLEQRQLKKSAYAKVDQMKEVEDQARVLIKQKWSQKRLEIRHSSKLAAGDRWRLTQETYIHQKAELSELTQPRRELCKKIREDYPFKSWTDFLRRKALQGNATALEIMRSTGEAVTENVDAAPRQFVDKSQEKKDVLAGTLREQDKKRLLAALKFQEKPDYAGQTSLSISPSGVLILSLPSGGSIRDTGKAIYFSVHDFDARKASVEYARLRWGNRIVAMGNQITFAHGRGTKKDDHTKQPALGM